MSPFSRFAHYFIAVARCGSLRRAAEQLHISASAINRQILQAEEAFGTPLFERLPEGLRMTTAGELLYDNLLRWQKEFRQTRQKFDELQGMKRGSVSVGMVQALAEGGFAAALAEIIASWPWLELDLQVADSHTVSQKVRQADLDVGLILDPQGQTGLSVLAFAELEVGIVMRPDHPLAGAKALSLGELSLERHIVPGAPLIVHERCLQTFVPYRTAIELCALDHGGLTPCDGGSNGIPSPTTTRYLSAMSVAKGVVTLTGQESLNGLGVTLTPTWDNAEGVTGWQRVCTITGNSALQQACEDVFRVK